MTLELVDLRPAASADRWWTPPFDSTVIYEHPHWWNQQVGDESWFVQVLEHGTEVARVEFDDPGGINPNYEGVPELGMNVRDPVHRGGLGGSGAWHRDQIGTPPS